MSNFKNELNEHRNVLMKLESLENQMLVSIDLILSSIKNGKKLILIGNGGSAADAQHIAAEFVGRFVEERRALPAIALTVDTSALTCIANDYGYDYVFQRQIEALGHKGDTLLAISTSGNSLSIINALKTAKKLGLNTISFLGRNGGKAKGLADCEVIVESFTTARIQEMHIFLGHHICAEVEKCLIGD